MMSGTKMTASATIKIPSPRNWVSFDVSDVAQRFARNETPMNRPSTNSQPIMPPLKITLAISPAAPEANRNASTPIKARIATASKRYVLRINCARWAGRASAAELPNDVVNSFIFSSLDRKDRQNVYQSICKDCTTKPVWEGIDVEARRNNDPEKKHANIAHLHSPNLCI